MTLLQATGGKSFNTIQTKSHHPQTYNTLAVFGYTVNAVKFLGPKEC